MPTLPPITLIGHPFGSTGRAQHIRAIARALGAAGVTAKILDIALPAMTEDRGLRAEFVAQLTATLPGGIRLFHLNGAEITRGCCPGCARRMATSPALTILSFRPGNCRAIRSAIHCWALARSNIRLIEMPTETSLIGFRANRSPLLWFLVNSRWKPFFASFERMTQGPHCFLGSSG